MFGLRLLENEGFIFDQQQHHRMKRSSKRSPAPAQQEPETTENMAERKEEDECLRCHYLSICLDEPLLVGLVSHPQ